MADIQMSGFAYNPDDPFLPLPYWRKMADMGVLFALGMRKLPASVNPQRAAAYAILALLDAQPDDPRLRLFRLWVYTSDWWLSDLLGGSGHGPDRLPLDEVADVVCLVAAAEERGILLRDVYLSLRQLVLETGGDVRPIWRRGSDLPWPRTPDVLTVKDVAHRLGVRRQTVYEWIEQGRLRATEAVGGHRGSFFMILESDLSEFREMEGDRGRHGQAGRSSGGTGRGRGSAGRVVGNSTCPMGTVPNSAGSLAEGQTG